MSRIALKTAFAAAGNQGAVDPEFIVWWNSGFPTVKDGTDPTSNAGVSISYDSSVPAGQVVSFATSYEQINWAVGTPYLVFGGYDRYQNTPSGGVIDFSNRSSWVYYGGKDGSNRYPFSYNSSGGSFVKGGVANNSGSVFLTKSITNECKICDIDTYSQLQGFSYRPAFAFNASTNILYTGNGSTTVYRHNWSGTTITGGITITVSGNPQEIACSPDGNYFATANDQNDLYIYDDRSTSGTGTVAYNVQAAFTAAGISGSDYRTIEFSPDSTKLLIGGDGVSGGLVVIYDLETDTATQMTVPAGSSNDKINGGFWFPDNNRYAIGGYGGAASHIGSFSSGGYLSEYGTFSARGGVVVIPFEDE
jgi:hypothetical protein